MKKIIVLALICLGGICQAQENNVYQKVRIYYQDLSEIKKLVADGLDLDHANHRKGVFIESDFSNSDVAIIKVSGMQYDVLHSNVQEFYINQNKGYVYDKSASQAAVDCNPNAQIYDIPSNFEHGSMGGFVTYTEALAQLDEMRTLYPNLISAKAPIGSANMFKTTEDRDIHWLRISDNPDTDESEPEVLYTAIHHAREPASLQQLLFYMWYLLENYATDPEVKAIVDNTELYFIPILNPDGYNFNSINAPNGGGMFRKNRRNHGNGDYGVDNNRNYDYTDAEGNTIWGTSGVVFDTGSDIYPGTGPFSEVENQAMKWFAEQHEFVLALNNHTYGDLLLYPFGYDYDKYTEDDLLFRAFTDELVSQNTMSNIIASGLYPASGDSDDYLYGDTTTHNKIFALTPEIGPSFWPAESEIDGICQSTMHMNLTSARMAHPYASISNSGGNYLEPQDLNTSPLFTVNYDIQNISLNGNANFIVSATAASDNIWAGQIGGTNTHDFLSALESSTGDLSFQLDPATKTGDVVSIDMILDNGIFQTKTRVDLIYGEPEGLFSDNATTIDNWTFSGDWEPTDQKYVSAPTAITDTKFGDYAANVNQQITLKDEVELDDGKMAWVSYFAQWDIEAAFDYVQFEISINEGISWIPLCATSTKPGSENQDQGEPVYDGTQLDWVLEEVDITDYLGNSVLFRFHLVSDEYVEADGFYFDDFSVNFIDSPVGIDENDGCLNFVEARPNPSTNATAFYFSSGINENSQLNIFNTTGQIVYSSSIPNGTTKHQVDVSLWEPGLYYYRLKSATATSKSKKMIVQH
ncbi:MAG: carboxypeptidase T [Candidatus Azotimanducaceae bacterium]|jgi:carboxypeptidase T